MMSNTQPFGDDTSARADSEAEDGGERRVAIVFVHGQGEQRPMSSVREFARTVWMTDKDLSEVDRPGGKKRRLRLWSTPTFLSSLLELRRLTTETRRPGEKAPDDIPARRYDFFEFYWAHFMVGNRLLHVANWFSSLLERPYSHIPDAVKAPRQAMVRLAQLLALFAAAFAVLTAGFVVRLGDKPSLCEVSQQSVVSVGAHAPSQLGFLAHPPQLLADLVCRDQGAAAPALQDQTAVDISAAPEDAWPPLRSLGELVSRVFLVVMTIGVLPFAFFWFFVAQRVWAKHDVRAAQHQEGGAPVSSKMAAKNGPNSAQAKQERASVQQASDRDLRKDRWRRRLVIAAIVGYVFMYIVALGPTFSGRDVAVALGGAVVAVFISAQLFRTLLGPYEWVALGAFVGGWLMFGLSLWRMEDGQIITALASGAVASLWLAWRMQFRAAFIASLLTIGAAIAARLAMRPTIDVYQAACTVEWLTPVSWGFVIALTIGFLALTVYGNARLRGRIIIFVIVSLAACAPLIGFLLQEHVPLIERVFSSAADQRVWSPAFASESDEEVLAQKGFENIETLNEPLKLAHFVGLHFFLTSVVVVAFCVIVGLVVILDRAFLTPVMGDSARYLRDLPENIEQRRRIRRAGVELLEKLHRDPSYERIIVVGHSLGSVVAYDILTLFWGLRCAHLHDAAPEEKLANVEKAARDLAQGYDGNDVRLAAQEIVAGLTKLYGKRVTYRKDEGPIVIGTQSEAGDFERQLLKNRMAIDNAVGALQRVGGDKPYLTDEEPASIREDCRRAAHALKTGPSAYDTAATSIEAVRDFAQRLGGTRKTEAADLLRKAASRLRDISRAHKDFRTAQREYFEALHSIEHQVPLDPEEGATKGMSGSVTGMRPVWRVSDLITMGSPLNFGPFLLTHSYGEFATRKCDGEFPTCPPFLEREHDRTGGAGEFGDLGFSYKRMQADLVGNMKTNAHFGPAHGALFAPVSWTNMFFVQEDLVAGDIVGGPCWRHFDLGVRDIAIDRRDTGVAFAHNEYWTSRLSNEALEALPHGELPKHVRILREVLNLRS